MSDERQVSLLAGQLDYLFEEQPHLRSAPASQLVDRLNHEDRLVRARSEQPLESDTWVQQRAEELESRFTTDDIDAALEIVRKRAKFDDD